MEYGNIKINLGIEASHDLNANKCLKLTTAIEIDGLMSKDTIIRSLSALIVYLGDRIDALEKEVKK